jgi:hypothetical protein
MNSKRLYLGLCAAVGLLVLAIVAGTYEANAFLGKRAEAVTTAKSKVAALNQEQAQLVKARASIARYQEVATIAKNIVPQDKDQAQAIREIVKLAADNGIVLSTVTFPASTLGGTGAAGSTTGNNQSQLKPAPGISGVYILPITVQSSTTNPVTYSQFIGFLEDLESNRRTALVSNITLQPDTTNPNLVSFTLTIDEYIKP